MKQKNLKGRDFYPMIAARATLNDKDVVEIQFLQSSCQLFGLRSFHLDGLGYYQPLLANEL